MSTDDTIAHVLPEPSAAERVRTVVERAASLSLTTGAREYDLLDMHEMGTGGRIGLRAAEDSPLALEVAGAPHGSVAALLEFTDIAPTPVRSRVRARVALSGWLAPGRGGGLVFTPARVTLSTAGGTVEVAPDEVTLAEPDPLAGEEAAMLTHLADAHGELVDELLALAGPRLPEGMVRAVPYALDRHALTLRCEYATGHCDLRLLFPAPARDAAEAGERVRQLLTTHRECGHRHHSHH
ncbi:DUF2470 domain-containing protein [Streptomyces sp. NPDC015131]|uniref:DUF2470 domain-containing protein n=1 Tax=Streptomyces sp. NPDC015131 TaxID=3364941 RepID=UPI0036F82B13